MKKLFIINTQNIFHKLMHGQQNPPEEEVDQILDIEENSLLPNSLYPSTNPKSELSKVNKILIVSVMIVILTIIFSYVLISLFPKPYSKMFIGLEKPAFDERKYKAIVLPNDMKVLLVSDPNSELGGVSIDVGVGSWNEPEKLPGLAHFLEHMLFMGSKKYPNVSEFNDFVSQNGGSYNAMTGSQNTNYFFSVSNFALEKSMDIFSRFFIDPLLNEETVSKEINAVNSEYTNDLTDPNWKLDIALEMISNKGNPASRFTIGNLKTLRDDPAAEKINTYEELQKFHSTHYSSNIMSAVILSNQPLSMIEKLAKEKFSEIPNKNLNRKEMNNFKEKAFDSQNEGLLIGYKSSKEEKTLQITFAIDSSLDDFKKKPLLYLSNLIDNENPNGFSVFMKEQGYVTALQTFLQSENLNFSLFVIHLELTEKGYTEMNGVLQLVFGYLRKIEKEGISKERFDEFKRIFAFSFLYKEKKKDLMEEIRELSYCLNTFPIENALNAQYIVEDYDEKLYKTVVSSFVPQNSILIIGNKDFTYNNGSTVANETSSDFLHNSVLNKYSEIYKFAYDIHRIPDELIADISNYNETMLKNVSLPNKNRYLPEEFNAQSDKVFKSIFSDNGVFKSAFNKKLSTPEKKNDPTPSLIVVNEKYAIWHKTDETFQLPMYVIRLALDSPIIHKTAKNSYFMLMLIEYLNQEAAKNLYDAINLGYKIEFFNSGKGLEILIKGYSDKTDLALLEILKLVEKINLQSDKFVFLQSIVLQNLRNDYNEAAYKHGKSILKKILRKYYYTPSEVEKWAISATLEDFNEFVKNYKSKLFVECLVYGNVQQNVTEQLVSNISSLINFESVNRDELMKEQILNIKDQIFQYRDFNENIEDQNNLLLNYYQYGPYMFNSSFLLGIINEKLANDAFNYLRGELQLGYLVTSMKINLYGVVGLAVVVQGSVADPLTMDEKTEEFLQIFSDSVMNMTDEEFEAIRQSNIKILTEGDKEIEERTSFVWDELRNQFYEFDKRSKAIDFLENLTKDQLINFYKSFIKQNIGKLSVQLYSQASYTILDNKTLDQNKAFIHVNGTSNLVGSDSNIFDKVPRYEVQVGVKKIQDYQSVPKVEE